MPRARPVRAIFFDAGNTLIRMDYAAIAGALARHGIRVAPDALARAEARARVRLDTEVLTPLGRSASTESRTIGERYLAFVLEHAGVADAPVVSAIAEWRRTYNQPFGLWTVVEPAAERALAAARAAGLGTAVVSNSNGSVRRILESLGLTRYLDFVIDSGEVGIEKPDPRIFAIAVERAGVDPVDAVYIGDLYAVDVVGARAAGLDVILLDPAGCWGERDCPSAPDVLAAVRLVVADAATA